MRGCPRPAAWLWLALAATTPLRAAETVLVESGSAMRYLANGSDPGIGLAWTAPGFDDAPWSAGSYGVGYETGAGAAALLRTTVASSSNSVYTRATFTIADPASVFNLTFGADYDDGYVVWINGVEVVRSAEMPATPPAWNTRAASHESSNGAAPSYGPLRDISAAGIPALRAGVNILAVGVWNTRLPSSDLVLVPRLAINRPASLARGPYLQQGASDSIVVRWRTDMPTDSRVAVGPAPGGLSDATDDPALTTDHSVRITDLLPSTTYYYSVGSTTQTLAGDDAAHRFTTSPPAGTGGPTRIWVLGDSGTADNRARAVRDAYRVFAAGRSADLWLMLGDNAYPDGTDAQYQSAVFDMYPETLAGAVLWPTLGNHDGHTADSTTQSGPYYDIFTLPKAAEAGGVASGTEAYYSFDYGPIHFICLDSYETDRSASGAMMTWLREDAMSTTLPWLVAFWHHPPYSKGSHDSDLETLLVEMRANALPILEAAGVDLVLTGHSHSYERSFLLDGHYGGSLTLEPSMIVDGGDGRPQGDGAYLKPAGGPAPREGAVYAVAGSSGQTGGGSLNHPAMYISLDTLGSMVIDVDGGRLDAVFLSAAGVVRDHFTILKEPPNASPVAVARAQATTECASPAGSAVRLDGTASHDDDSTPGTRDDIVSYEWFEDFGAPSQRLIGTGAELEVVLPLGLHAITLRVTDSQGASSTDDVTVTVADTTPPVLTLSAAPEVLWPPNHRMVAVRAEPEVHDGCGPAAFELVSITSSEPARPRGARSGASDIQGARTGTPDTEFLLRAERSGGGPGRVYTIVYRAVDASGNPATATLGIIVPHDLKRASGAPGVPAP